VLAVALTTTADDGDFLLRDERPKDGLGRANASDGAANNMAAAMAIVAAANFMFCRVDI